LRSQILFILKIEFSKTLKWLLLILIIGVITGTSSAVFLIVLEAITNYRINNHYLVIFLPFAGLFIGYFYYKYGEEAVKGNNLIFESEENPETKIPVKMAPMVLIATWITHLFGASAGREGTAVQMGIAMAQPFKKLLKLEIKDNNLLLILGVSGGFASVFGTPWAGAIFALEIFIFQKKNFKYFIPSILTAFVAHYVCLFLGATHTIYPNISAPTFNLELLFWILVLGIVFGFTSWFFCTFSEIWTKLFSKIKIAYLKPFFGGIILALLFYFLPLQDYEGLGIPSILKSFNTSLGLETFIFKLILTTFTLSVGFKGGEVTPLFFIGATLGSALFVFLPLPLSFLAALGFVAVFAAATQSPVASAVMGAELFGIEIFPYLLLVCILALLFSGEKRIYRKQRVLRVI
jgi:H+/Cl- antiporter ClcA